MQKPYAIFFVLLPFSYLLSSCVEPELRDTPATAIVRSYTALNQQDSIGYIESLAREKREVYEAIPGALHSLLEESKGHRVEVDILNVNSENGAATVLYDLKITGEHPMIQDSLIAHAYLEENGWKYGY